MLTGVLIFLLVLVALLAVPVSVNFKLSWQREFSNELKVSWMFGLVRLTMSPRTRMSKTSKSKSVSKAANWSVDAQKGRPVTRLVFQKQLRQRIFKYVSDLWHAIRKENVVVHIRAGLDDPADTGQLWAVIGPVAGVLADVQRHSINIEPDFLSPGFELDGSGYLRFSPLRVVLISIGLLLSPSVWHGVRQINTGR